MYLIFGGEEYYGAGGANDLLASTDDKDDAISTAKSLVDGSVIIKTKPLHDGDENTQHERRIEWVHVYCTTDNKITFKSRIKSYGDIFEGVEIESVEIKPAT